MRTVQVSLDAVSGQSRGYDVLVGSGILAELGPHLRRVLPRAGRVMLVFDAALPAELVDTTARSLTSSQRNGQASGLTCSRLALACSESRKGLDSVERILTELTRAQLDRGDAVVALGGGILGDVAGFAAAVYRRGIAWVNCPTTLLSMVDASVGGKTGVNLTIPDEHGSPSLRKNMAGAFHQPALVVADVDSLASLADREFRAGLAECVKHGLLAGGIAAAGTGHSGLLEWVKANLPAVRSRDSVALAELVARNVAIKAAVIAVDERETSGGPTGGRMALNLGHTFAHAFEAVPGLGLSHGEAVGLGLLAAAWCSERLGLVPTGLRAMLDGLLGSQGIGLPTRIGGLPQAGVVLRLMLDDKKVSGGRLRLILPAPGWTVRVVDDPARDVVAGAIDSVRSGG